MKKMAPLSIKKQEEEPSRRYKKLLWNECPLGHLGMVWSMRDDSRMFACFGVVG